MNKRIRINGTLYEAVNPRRMNESYKVRRIPDGEQIEFDYAEPDFCSVWWERDDDTTNDEGETEYIIGINYNNDYIYTRTDYYYSTVKGDRIMSKELRRLADRVQLNEPTTDDDIEEFADDFGLERE